VPRACGATDPSPNWGCYRGVPSRAVPKREWQGRREGSRGSSAFEAMPACSGSCTKLLKPPARQRRSRWHRCRVPRPVGTCCSAALQPHRLRTAREADPAPRLAAGTILPSYGGLQTTPRPCQGVTTCQEGPGESAWRTPHLPHVSGGQQRTRSPHLLV